MNNEPKTVDLDKVSHSVRAAQAVLQYGIGAMVDFQDQTLVTAEASRWETARIRDERFEKALGVNYFVLPKCVAYERFPRWYFCPQCRRFQKLSDWDRECQKQNNSKFRQYQRQNEFVRNKPAYGVVKNMKCPQCWQDLVVARIVTICENGHLNDFPWVEWVHARSNRPICNSPSLKIKTGASGTEGLEGLQLSCCCGAWTTLAGSFSSETFAELSEKTGIAFDCSGNHPFKHKRDKECRCSLKDGSLKTVQRGASSVYFPLIYNSLVIPPYANRINTKIENSESLKEIENERNGIRKSDPQALENPEEEWMTDWIERIQYEIGESAEDIRKILLRKWTKQEVTPDIDSVAFKVEEYSALNGEFADNDPFGDFVRKEIPIEEYKLPFLKSVALIEKIRVVKALTGFSRISPVPNMEAPQFVSVKDEVHNCYPAYEVRGEGIFLEFDSRAIDKWIEANPEVETRAALIQKNYDKSFIGKGRERHITPKFVMLHTLSHLLISQLSFECGYGIASLSERLYCAEENDCHMNGIFIYTASGDSEGTLGGLVRQGYPDLLPKILKKAVGRARTCSNDPVCIMSKGQGRDSLNLAACYACGLLPETCCEERNGFLDRGMIVGTFDKDIGFFNKSWS